MQIRVFIFYAGKYDQIVPITSARVPIVKFYMKQWYLDAYLFSAFLYSSLIYLHALLLYRKMQCDISLENKLV